MKVEDIKKLFAFDHTHLLPAKWAKSYMIASSFAGILYTLRTLSQSIGYVGLLMFFASITGIDASRYLLNPAVNSIKSEVDQWPEPITIRSLQYLQILDV